METQEDIQVVTDRIQQDPDLAKAFATIVRRIPTFGQVTMDFRYGRLSMLSTRWDTKFSTFTLREGDRP